MFSSSKKTNFLFIWGIMIVCVFILITSTMILREGRKIPNEEAKDYYVVVYRQSGILYVDEIVSPYNSFHKDVVSSIEVDRDNTVFISLYNNGSFTLINEGEDITIYKITVRGSEIYVLRVRDIKNKLIINLE